MPHPPQAHAAEQRIFAGTGSLTDAPARLMTSDDYGTTWAEVARHESPPGGFSRVYFLGATEGMLFASGREHPDGAPFGWCLVTGRLAE